MQFLEIVCISRKNIGHFASFSIIMEIFESLYLDNQLRYRDDSKSDFKMASILDFMTICNLFSRFPNEKKLKKSFI